MLELNLEAVGYGFGFVLVSWGFGMLVSYVFSAVRVNRYLN